MGKNCVTRIFVTLTKFYSCNEILGGNLGAEFCTFCIKEKYMQHLVEVT